jgi:hypothetical protein
MKQETMLAKLVLAEELLTGVSGKPGDDLRQSIEHVVQVVRALVEREAPAGGGPPRPRRSAR